MPTNSVSILVVDDEPINLATLKQVLEPFYSLVFARNGVDCLSAAKKHQPALILLDIQMPDMDGYAVCRLLKADPETRHIPVIFVSSLSEVGDETAGFDSGGVDYITKPVSPALVRARVRTHLSLVHTSTLERYIQQLRIEQAKTARLSRIHALLSGTNSAIVRVRDPQELYEEACHIAVDKGGFGVAWIGLRDAGNKIQIAASRGIDADTLTHTLHLDDHQPLASLGIVNDVFEKDKVSFCNSIHAANIADVTCSDAYARGYHSAIALPLTLEEDIAGVMVLYAREKNSFDEEELKLLDELAGDISLALQSIENKKRANFLFYYDALTTLPNTTLFLDRLEQIISAARRERDGAFVIALNLNQFKLLNDSFGWHIGDQILKTVAHRLSHEVSCVCTVARISADNFALVAKEQDCDNINAFCEDILECISAPIKIENKIHEISARIGVAIFPRDAEDSETLFKNADIALKQTAITKTPYLFYSAELNARIAERIELERQLKVALSDDQFVLHYQPKVDLGTGKIVGAEALIRWNHPELGLVGPIKFIPFAEENGLIVPIGEWVIHTVCAQQAAWLAQGVPVVPVSLNLSAQQFSEGNIFATVDNALKQHRLDPHWLELELTETMVMQNPDKVEDTLQEFRSLGLHLSLDDFGTGYSSLAYLKRFPFNTVKIDRTFVTDIISNPDDSAIASAIIGMAHSLRMHVIAEGVETEEQLKFLRAQHCNQIQGYFFCRPIPANSFREILLKGKSLELEVPPGSQQQTLLIVEKETVRAEKLIHALQGQGYRILTAQDGKQALALLATHSVQVILCTQTLSSIADIEFFTFAARLYPDTMRIVLSSYAELESVLEFINRGEIYRFITEPWDDDMLRQNINEAFRRYRPATRVL